MQETPPEKGREKAENLSIENGIKTDVICIMLCVIVDVDPTLGYADNVCVLRLYHANVRRT